MVERPIYVGVGTCGCHRTDVQLYRVPGMEAMRLACSQCLAIAGLEVPRSRTAEDIEIVDGEMRWKP